MSVIVLLPWTSSTLLGPTVIVCVTVIFGAVWLGSVVIDMVSVT